MSGRTACSILAAAALLFGRDVSGAGGGNLTGIVELDGARAPGVRVSVASRSLETDEHGEFSATGLPAGEHAVVFERDGAQRVTLRAAIREGQTTVLEADLSSTPAADAITVTAAAPPIVESYEVQATYEADFIDRLPIARTLQGTATLAPGVTDTGFGFRGRKKFLVISGAPASDNLYLVDGTVVNENVRGQAHNLYIEDAIDETTILTAGISAEYGRFTGGVIATSTKSGGNEFSGSLRDSASNPSWSASREGIETPDDSTHVLEGTLGGRVITDRLWFFAAGRYYADDHQAYLAASSIPYVVSNNESRFELKLTGQVSMRHSVAGSLAENDFQQKNNCQFGCLERTTVDPETSRPATYTSFRYNGLFSDGLIVDASWSRKDFSFIGLGGESRDPASGSWGYDATRNAFFGAPIFCGVCEEEQRDSTNGYLKGSYYVSTSSFGTHSIVGGYERWIEQNVRNNFQSASDFGIVTFNAVDRDSTGVLRPVFEPGETIIGYYPILTPTDGSDFITDSVFLNDRWDLNPHWSLNLGARFDRNDGHDSAGNAIHDDGALSPRLGLSFDLRGDGRRRVNASYSTYVTRLAAIIGDTASSGGTPAYFAWVYEGPSINGDGSLDTRGAMTQLFEWFFSQGGTSRNPDVAEIPGVTSVFGSSLRTPSVTERTAGFGQMFGRSGFVRVDYIDRDWRDFYAVRTDLTTAVQASASGAKFDRSVIGNSNALSRSYEGIQIQGGYRIFGRMNLGGNYTYSKLRGNVVAESLTEGPRPETPLAYPEFKAFARNNPSGYLPADQRHKARVWAEGSFLTFFGEMSVAVLHRYESGAPYEMAGEVRPMIQNPGYATPPLRVSYFFSDRGALRWDDVSATDLGVSFRFPVRRATLFFQSELLNIFDNDAQIGGDTTVLTSVTDPKSISSFDPRIETPVEGIHYRRGPNFGQPVSIEHYQQPRTFQLSAGIRF